MEPRGSLFMFLIIQLETVVAAAKWRNLSMFRFIILVVLISGLLLSGCDGSPARDDSYSTIYSFDPYKSIKCPLCEKQALLLSIEPGAMVLRKNLYYRCGSSHQTMYSWNYRTNKYYMYYSRKVGK